MMSLQPKTIDYNGSCWIAISEYSKKASDVRRLTKKVASLTSRCKELESRLNDWENPSKESASSVQRGLARKQEAYENLKQRYDKAKQRLKDVGKKQQDFENKYAEEVKLRLKKERENKELNKKIEKLTRENMRLSGELKAANELNDALKTKCDELLNSKMETESESNRKQIENDDLKNRLAKQKAQMSKDSSNSGLPTSKTPIGKNKRKPVVSSREKSDRKIGGQPGHPQHKLGKCIEGLITGTEFHVPEDFRDQLIEDGKMPDFLICPKCGTKLSEEDFLIRDKMEFDFEFRIKRTRHRFIDITCHECGSVFKVGIPNHLKEEAQYGPMIKTYICLLSKVGIVSVNRIQKIIEATLELSPSEGFISDTIQKFGELTEEFARKVATIFQCFAVVHWDDTCITVNGEIRWLRSYATKWMNLFVYHEKKDLEGLIDDGILTVLTAIHKVMHDHNTVNYNEIFNYLNLECNQHLLRDLAAVLCYVPECEWAKELKEMLSGMIHERNELVKANENERTLPEETVRAFNEFLDRTLEEQGKLLTEQIAAHEREQRALGNESKKIVPPEHLAVQLRIIKRLLVPEYRKAYFAWMTDFSVPVTNNVCESSFRLEKTRQKVTGGHKNDQAAENHANATSYLNTCELNGISKGTATKRVWQGKPVTVDELGLEGKMDFKNLKDNPNVADPVALKKRLGIISSDSLPAEPKTSPRPEPYTPPTESETPRPELDTPSRPGEEK